MLSLRDTDADSLMVALQCRVNTAAVLTELTVGHRNVSQLSNYAHHSTVWSTGKNNAWTAIKLAHVLFNMRNAWTVTTVIYIARTSVSSKERGWQNGMDIYLSVKYFCAVLSISNNQWQNTTGLFILTVDRAVRKLYCQTKHTLGCKVSSLLFISLATKPAFALQTTFERFAADHCCDVDTPHFCI